MFKDKEHTSVGGKLPFDSPGPNRPNLREALVLFALLPVPAIIGSGWIGNILIISDLLGISMQGMSPPVMQGVESQKSNTDDSSQGLQT